MKKVLAEHGGQHDKEFRRGLGEFRQPLGFGARGGWQGPWGRRGALRRGGVAQPFRERPAECPATVTARKGDYYVSGAQPAANLIPNLLEPQAEFGFIRYQMFKLVPEKGATFPFLRVAKRQVMPLETVK